MASRAGYKEQSIGDASRFGLRNARVVSRDWAVRHGRKQGRARLSHRYAPPYSWLRESSREIVDELRPSRAAIERIDAPPARSSAICSRSAKVKTAALQVASTPWPHPPPFAITDRVLCWAGADIDRTGRLPSDLIVAAAEADPNLARAVAPYLLMRALPESLDTVQAQAREIYATGWRRHHPTRA